MTKRRDFERDSAILAAVMRNDWYIDWIGGFSSTTSAGSAVTEERRGIVGDVDSVGAQRDFSMCGKAAHKGAA